MVMNKLEKKMGPEKNLEEGGREGDKESGGGPKKSPKTNPPLEENTE